MTTGNLHSRVKAVWRREQVLRFMEGALAFLRWGLPSFVFAVAVDWVVDLPSLVRAVFLVLVVGVPSFKAWRAGWKHLSSFNATRTALQIEEHRGGMESLLVTAVQLGEKQAVDGTSSSLAALACSNAEAASSGISPRESIKFLSLKRPALIALGVAALLGILSFTHGTLLRAGLVRIFAPWVAIEYPTRTNLELAQGDIVVQEGKPVEISARVTGVVPRRAKIALRTGRGGTRVRKLDVENGKCEYTIDTAFRGFRYRLSAGDDRSDWHEVKVVSAPHIKKAQVLLQYPSYTRREAETVEALTLTVPETTTLNWTLQVDRPLREARLELAGEKAIPMNISEDGLTVTMTQTAADSRAYRFSWVDREYGFLFNSANQYLQVAPDRPPRVELTSPARNLYATLGRKIDLAFRGRDDHGIGESVVTYRLDKTEEERVPFEPASPIDGSEQTVDWDYRTVLTNLVVGQTVTFAIELADRYPGDTGPHRARSETRRVQFMSAADYLAQVERQKKRLLSRLRAIYREERKVHEVVLRLDRDDPTFIQTCQLEAVRQDLMRERLNKLAAQMQDLADDIAANSISNETISASLTMLRENLLKISSDQLAQASSSLRNLASELTGKGDRSGAAQARAAYMVNASARELSLLVLQLGYEDAAEVMARELHAAAETQAALRLRTITASAGGTGLADEQDRLAKWLTRLFAASPRNEESTVEDALIEFTLTRLVKQMVNGGIDQRLEKAAGFVSESKFDAAARLQTEVIAALLKAEFRLRVGAEREALVKALDIFRAEVDGLGELRAEIKAVDATAFKKHRAKFGAEQRKLHAKLQLLLMPVVPARRIHLFDDSLPSPPPVEQLLSEADAAMNRAFESIQKADPAAAEKAQLKAEDSFKQLADIVVQRVAAMSQAVRIERLSYIAGDIDQKIDRFIERQLSLLEKTEDAAADDKVKSDYLAEQQDGLAEVVEELKSGMQDELNSSLAPEEQSVVAPRLLDSALDAMSRAVPLLKADKAGEADALEEKAMSFLTQAKEALKEHGATIGAFSAAVSAADKAAKPGPYVREIEEEQRDMLEITKKTKPEDLPGLALAQKNLVHAVNAVLTALDPIEHMIKSGTTMLFAKEDIGAAGEAMEVKDSVEALDAQEYIVETMENLRGKVDVVIPQYDYLREIVEAIQGPYQEGMLIREDLSGLGDRASGKIDNAGIAAELTALKQRTEKFSTLMNDITGFGIGLSSLKDMTDAERLLKSGDKAAAIEKMSLAGEALKSDGAKLCTLMTHLNLVLAAPELGTKLPEEVILLQEVLALAAEQKGVYRESFVVNPKELSGYEAKLLEFEKACGPFIERAKTHKNPPPPEEVKQRGEPEQEPDPAKPIPPANLQLKLVEAKNDLSRAAAGCKALDRTKAVESQKMAAGSLRHFVAEYALKFVAEPGDPGPQPPAPTTDFSESDDIFKLFMPGAVTGVKPPDARLEWEVLGRRDRAALNENFARELPLEYRAILKDYYERLAK